MAGVTDGPAGATEHSGAERSGADAADSGLAGSDAAAPTVAGADAAAPTVAGADAAAKPRAKRRRVTTAPPPGSDPTPQPEEPRGSGTENDARLRADKPPHWG